MTFFHNNNSVPSRWCTIVVLSCSWLLLLFAKDASAFLPASVPKSFSSTTHFMMNFPKHWGGKVRMGHRRLFNAIEDTAQDGSGILSQLDEEEDDDNDDDTAATLRSITFSNIGKEQEPQLLCNFLMELGACSTSLVDADRGTDQERAIFHENPSHFGGCFQEESMSQTAVTTHVWDQCHVSATFAASTDLEWIWDIVKETYPVGLPNYTLSKVEDKDWVLHVQQSWKPIVLDPFVLKFPWHTPELVQEAIRNQQSQNMEEGYDSSHNEDPKQMIELSLQGGIAFGTGEHPTTQLCLEWIASLIRSEKMQENINLMDYGTGSGVLGIGACKLLPSSLTAVGVDIDVDAVNIANANADENKVSMVSYLSDLVQQQQQQQESEQDPESKSVLMRAFSSDPNQVAQVLPEEWNGPIYDICVANILAGPLITLAKTLAGLVRPKGHLGLSGIMSSQSDMILEAYTPFFEEMCVERESDGWVLITGVRRTN